MKETQCAIFIHLEEPIALQQNAVTIFELDLFTSLLLILICIVRLLRLTTTCRARNDYFQFLHHDTYITVHQSRSAF